MLALIDRLAIAYLATDDEITIESARRMYDAGVDAEHMGDCTKVAATCLRCLTDDYRLRAEHLIRRAAEVGVRIEDK